MFRRRRTYFIGIPLFLLAALVAVSVRGQMQPRPEGYTLTGRRTVAPVATQVALEPEVEATPAATQYTPDARNKVEWAFFDLGSGSIVPSTLEDFDWDLGFRARSDVGTRHPGKPRDHERMTGRVRPSRSLAAGSVRRSVVNCVAGAATSGDRVAIDRDRLR
jgi:hypothetical protein